MSSGEPLGRRIGMNVIYADGPGSPDVLTLSQRPTPDPEPGQVLVRVSSASVNFSDVMRRRGDPYPIPTTWPYTPGSEIAGTVERLGDGVDAALRGKTVFALAGDDASGGYAQYALCRAETAIPVPEGVTADQASTLVVAGVTPMLMLTEAATVGPGSTVLVQSAGGGVGGFAVAIARALGATVIACGGTQEHRARASELGADHVIDTSAPRWSEQVLAATGGRGVDVALEGGGESTFSETLASLAPFGTAIVYGFASGKALRFDPASIERFFYTPAPNQCVRAFNLGGYAFGRRDAFANALGRVIELARHSVVLPRIETVPLASAADAHRRLETRAVTGKIVLQPWE